MPAAILAACEPKMPVTVSTTPRIDVAGMAKAVARISQAARPAVLGVGLMNLESGRSYTHNPERRFPMQSVFKLPLAAAVLSERDAGRLSLSEVITLEETDLSTPLSAIAAAWPSRRDYSLDALLQAAVVDSDNTAADVLMKRIGGPGAVTAWLAGRRAPGLRVDRYERQFQPELHGLASFRPEWRTAAGFAAAVATVPPAARMAAMRAYMADPRDTATPAGMLEFLRMLDAQELISQDATGLLLRLMAQTERGAGRIRAGLPEGAFLAHRPGTSGADQGLSVAHNDVGIFTLEDRRSYALAIFLSGSTLDGAGRDAVIADVTRAAVRAVG